MKKLLFSLVLICLQSLSYSQKVATIEQQLILEDKMSNSIAVSGSNAAFQNSETGTFQLIIKQPDLQFAITEDFLTWVKENRLEDQDQTLKIEEMVYVFIPSRKKIEAEDFSPIITVRHSY